MSSEARRCANRRNARLSTGPRSAAGKARSGRNALRHGLNTALRADPVAEALAAETAAGLVAQAGLDRVTADRLSELIAHLARIQQAKQAAIAAELAAAAPRGGHLSRAEQAALATGAALPRLVVLDGYARKAHSRLRRMLRDL